MRLKIEAECHGTGRTSEDFIPKLLQIGKLHWDLWDLKSGASGRKEGADANCPRSNVPADGIHMPRYLVPDVVMPPKQFLIPRRGVSSQAAAGACGVPTQGACPT
jgi:hypothetical protein